jgi:hypothetical protein
MKNLLATLALATVLPVAAHAAPLPIFVGQIVSDDVDLLPGATASFEFEAAEDMRIKAISYTLNGVSAADLLNVDFGVNTANDSLSPGQVTSGGGLAEGGKISFVNLDLMLGDTFTIEVNDGVANPVNFDFVFVPTQVPVPAAGLLLGSLLLGGGAVARRKSKR